MTERLADPERLRSLLDRFEQLWREAGSTRSESLLPGLSEDEVEEWFGIEGLVPPTEAVVWWGWHADYDRSIGRSLALPPTGFTFLSLPEAMDTYRRRESDALWIGTPTLFPILEGSAKEVAIHLDVHPGQQSPVRTFMYEDPLAYGDYVEATSLEELVERWAGILELGLCRIEDGLMPVVDEGGVEAAFGPNLGSAYGTRSFRPLRQDPPELTVT